MSVVVTIFSRLVLPCAVSGRVSSLLPCASVEDVVWEELVELADTLVKRGVGLLGCQKVVHPLLKERLREQVIGGKYPGKLQPTCTSSVLVNYY